MRRRFRDHKAFFAAELRDPGVRAAQEGNESLPRMSTPVDTEARTVAALRVVANVRELELLAKLRA